MNMYIYKYNMESVIVVKRIKNLKKRENIGEYFAKIFKYVDFFWSERRNGSHISVIHINTNKFIGDHEFFLTTICKFSLLSEMIAIMD